MRLRLITLRVTVLLLMWAPQAGAATVYLDSGKVFQGLIVEETDTYLKLESEGQTYKIRFRMIGRIERDGVSSSAKDEADQDSPSASAVDSEPVLPPPPPAREPVAPVDTAQSGGSRDNGSSRTSPLGQRDHVPGDSRPAAPLSMTNSPSGLTDRLLSLYEAYRTTVAKTDVHAMMELLSQSKQQETMDATPQQVRLTMPLVLVMLPEEYTVLNHKLEQDSSRVVLRLRSRNGAEEEGSSVQVTEITFVREDGDWKIDAVNVPRQAGNNDD